MFAVVCVLPKKTNVNTLIIRPDRLALGLKFQEEEKETDKGKVLELVALFSDVEESKNFLDPQTEYPPPAVALLESFAVEFTSWLAANIRASWRGNYQRIADPSEARKLPEELQDKFTDLVFPFSYS